MKTIKYTVTTKNQTISGNLMIPVSLSEDAVNELVLAEVATILTEDASLDW